MGDAIANYLVNRALIWLSVIVVVVASLAFLAGRLSAAEPERRVIYFSATWCKYCPSQTKIIKSVESKGYKVRYLDYDKNTEARISLNVKGVPCTIVGRMEGTEFIEEHRFHGQTSQATILDALKGQKGIGAAAPYSVLP